MKAHFKIYILVCFIFALFSYSCTKEDDLDDNANGETDLTAEDIIKKYSEETELKLSTAVISEIESLTNQFPINASPGIDPVLVEINNAMGTNLLPIINQRDWAYAYLGIQYTLAGIFIQGQESLLTQALWCFLEAAALNPNEPEHLANIAFHLNGMGKYYDALTILQKAKSLNKDTINVMVSNNLAYTYAALNDPVMALTELNRALSLWPNNEFLLEKNRLYSEGISGTNSSNYASVMGMSCSEVYDAELDPPSLDPNQLSPIAAVDFFAEKLYPLEEEYLIKWVEIPMPSCPLTLSDMMELWPQLGNLADIRENCYMVTNTNEECERCDKPYEISIYGLACAVANEVISKNQNGLPQALELSDKYRDIILNTIKEESSITDNDKKILTEYIKEYFLWSNASDWITCTGNICGAKDFEIGYRPQTVCFTYQPPQFPLPFGGQMSCWFGAGTLSLDLNKGEVEITFGQGWQGTVAWNWKTNTPTIGIGYGVNLDKLVQPGAFIRFTPGKGLVGSVDFNAARDFVLPGYTTPSVPIVKLGAFMN